MTTAFCKTALANFEAGLLPEAEQVCRDGLAQMPASGELQHLLGRVRLRLGDIHGAIALFREACAGIQGPEPFIDLGKALALLDYRVDAEAAYQSALRLDPGAAEAHFHLGDLLAACGDLEAATLSYRQTIALEPRHVDAQCRLGSILLSRGQIVESLACYKRVLEIDPDSAEAYNGLGRLLHRLDRIGDAEAHFRWALELDPNHAGANNDLAGVFFCRGQFNEARACGQRAIDLRPDDSATASGLLFCLNYNPVATNEEIFAAHLNWAKTYAPEPLDLAFRNERIPERPLRVGYVSGDFRQHAVNYFLEPTLAAHDHSVVDVFCYSNNLKDDDTTSRLRGVVDHWIPIAKYSDREAADRIYRDGIDILVDLSGHTSRSRLEVFALKPAPVQVSWLGHLNTTGLPTIDYRITDAIADPPGEADRFHSERLFRLDRCHFCYRPRGSMPAPVPGVPARRRKHVTFGCLHNTCKVSAQVVEVWSRILHATPGSRLVFTASLTRDQSMRTHYRDLFAATGIAPERIDFSPAERIDYGRVAGFIDIALDPFPYNGSTTTCETLWSGIPVITLRGQRHAGRVSASILSAIGLADLIGEDLDHYTTIAIGLACDLSRLTVLRAGMKARMKASPLFDETGFTRALEAAYRTMWRAYCAA